MSGTVTEQGRRAADGAERAAHRGARSPVLRRAARIGLVARGVIHGVVGLLALQIAFGSGGDPQADQQGAVQELAAQPFGAALIWAVGCGLAALALWRVVEAIVGPAGPDGGKAGKRLGAAGGSVACAVISFSVLSFAVGAGGGETLPPPRPNRVTRW
ncbi:DUF1206 domain-containing protein, partial [Streptomyces calidiresistens]|uniref:DUF1206 domain-containing protein n=1 Tax=Streptomyces calidiresistens TaxID=1485586 RepID=UPI002B205DE9